MFHFADEKPTASLPSQVRWKVPLGWTEYGGVRFAVDGKGTSEYALVLSADRPDWKRGIKGRRGNGSTQICLEAISFVTKKEMKSEAGRSLRRRGGI